MDVLKNKKYTKFDYISRYAGTPYYYHEVDQKEVPGLGKNMLKNTS
jgi:hypothetical protein